MGFWLLSLSSCPLITGLNFIRGGVMQKKYEAVIGHENDYILVICPGSHDQSGSKLLATLEANPNCRHVWLADTLDAWNRLRTCESLDDARAQALENGDEWLKRHDFILKYPLIRWETLRSNRSFKERELLIREILEAPCPARDAFREQAGKHAALTASRWRAGGKIPNVKRFEWLSMEYLIEEYAGLSLIRSVCPFPEIYPGEYFPCDILVKSNRIRPEIDLTLPVHIPVEFLRLAA